jgi:diacylglycerol O-acyltransferase / wax synthase
VPVDIVAVQAFLAEQRSQPLPKERPLWQGFLLSPVRLSDGRVGAAVVSRFHHAIADGVRLTQVMLSMCDTESVEVAARVARKGVKGASGGKGVTDGLLQAAGDMGSAVVQGVGGLVAGVSAAARHPKEALVAAPQRALAAAISSALAVEQGWDLMRHPDRFLDFLEAYGVPSARGANDLATLTKLTLGDSDASVWTGTPGTTKAVAWSDPISLDAIKVFGRSKGATVNDVLLAGVAGGLRRYLLQHGQTPGEVAWMVPVNLKPFEENLPEDLGNYFALVMVPMSLDAEHPHERLRQTQLRMKRIKNSDEAVITFGVQRLISSSPDQIAVALTNFFANKAVGVLTNVPGPAQSMSFAGAPVHQIVGFAPCSGDQPMTTTIFSYNGGVTVGFATDATLVPDPEELARLVVADLRELGVQF